MKPFIHLFKTPAHYYFYDVNKNESVRIDEASFHYLKDSLSNNQCESQAVPATERVHQLTQQGYLSTNRVQEIEHPDSCFLEEYTNRKVSSMVLQVTQNCNLKCEYCPYVVGDKGNRTHSSKRMSPELIEQSLAMLNEKSVDCDEVSISFYGGEPLIEYESIVRTVILAKTMLHKKSISYSMTTNGTLLTEDMIRFFKEHNFSLTFSLDGPKELNDRNRIFRNSSESVFDHVMEKLNLIETKFPEYLPRISTNMVIDPTQDFYKYKEFFLEYPILQKILVMPTLVEDYTTEGKFKEIEDFAIKSEHSKFLYYLQDMKAIDSKDQFFLQTMFASNVVKLKEDWAKLTTLGTKFCPSGQCIPGMKKVFVDVDGTLFPCERVNEMFEYNKMGTVQKGIQITDAYRILNVAKLNQGRCENCFAFRHCSLCIKGHEEGINSPEVINPKCKKMRADFHQMLKARALHGEMDEMRANI